jgi:hypothetical protein
MGSTDVPEHPNVPHRATVVLALGAVLVAGILGAIIGYRVVQVDGQDGMALVVGALVGGAVAAFGASLVAVLVMRAMAEWRITPPTPYDANVNRRNPSA